MYFFIPPVDASEAGDGTLEITVSHNGQNIPNNALAIGKNRYECSFIGHQPGTYKVNVLYNNLHVNGEFFNFSFLKSILYSVLKNILLEKSVQMGYTGLNRR